jgi:hypothetical protein
MEGTIRRGRTIVHVLCRMPAVRGMAATGDIVRRTIVHRCRRTGQGTAVQAMASRDTVPGVQSLGIPGIVREEVRVLELRDIVRADPGMETVQEMVREIAQGMGTVR